jgi:serine/threonine-protein kinase
MTITPELWPVLSKLLDEALDLAPEAREPWLNSLPSVHATLRGRLHDLLQRHGRIENSGFLATLPNLEAVAVIAGDNSTASTLKSEAAVGPYVIEEEIGSGGMGIVWRARRADGVVKRPVALKLLRAGFYSRELLARFDRERDILAELAHPNIARLYDAGATDTGQPFIALEYVEGLPLTEYCDHRRLDVQQRLTLLLQVLKAVQYAHSHLVIHRDLKPSNILVTADGQVRLLDFGIAKLLPDGAGANSAVTEMGARVLTPGFAAPEQITGAPVTIATDVYSLGVILYELLTGCRPYRLKRMTRGELEDAVVKLEPERPSRAPIEEESAMQRGATVRRLRAALSGDLDTIVLKALKKTPSERYATVAAMTLDLERYLTGDPVLAHPDSVWYQTRKFLQRHVLAVSAAGAIVLTMLAGLGATLWEARLAHANERRAVAIEDFALGIFRANASNQPNPERARATTARELLAQGAGRVDHELAGQPEAKLAMLRTLGEMHHALGLDAEAARLHRPRIALADQLYGELSDQAVAARLDYASALSDSHNDTEAKPVVIEIGKLLDRRKDFTSGQRAQYWLLAAETLADRDMLMGRSFAERAVSVCRAARTNCDLSESLYRLGVAAKHQSAYAPAVAAFEESILIATARGVEGQKTLPRDYANLGEAYWAGTRDFDRAQAALRRAYTEALRLGGEWHGDTIETELRYGRFPFENGRPREGLELIGGAQDRLSHASGPDYATHGPLVTGEYGVALSQYGQPEAATEHLRHAAALQQGSVGKDHYYAQVQRDLGFALIEAGHYSEADAALNEAGAAYTAIGISGNDSRLNLWRASRALLALDRGYVDEARADLRELAAGKPGSKAAFTRQTQIALLESDIDLAARDLTSARARNQTVIALLETDASQAKSTSLYAEALVQRGRIAAAQSQCRAGLMDFDNALLIMRQVLDTNAPRLAETLAYVGSCQAALGDAAHARAALAEARGIASRLVSQNNRLSGAVASARRVIQGI